MIPHPHLPRHILPVARAVQPQPCGRPGHHPLTVTAGVLVTVGAGALGLALGLGFAGHTVGAVDAVTCFVLAWAGAAGLLAVQHRRAQRREAYTREWRRRDAENGVRPMLRLVHGFREAK